MHTNKMMRGVFKGKLCDKIGGREGERLRAREKSRTQLIRKAAIENLESRTLLSAAPGLAYGPDTAYQATPLTGPAISYAAQDTTLVQPAHLVIIPIFDSSITNDPNAAAIEAVLNSTLLTFENDISTPITVTLKLKQIFTGLAQSNKPVDYVTYTQYRNALNAHATTAYDKTAVGTLPTGPNNPVNGATTVILSDPNARALGLPGTPADGIDGTIGLNISLFNLSRSSLDPEKYLLTSSFAHEIDEILGSATVLNNLQNGDAAPTNVIFPEDLYRVDENGDPSFNTDINTQAYFSIDGGNTAWARFNQKAGGDFSDWYSDGSQLPQVQDAQGTQGATPALGIELNMLDILGYTLATGVNGGRRPDLAPFKPATWSSPLVVTTVKGGLIDADSISPSDTVYVDAAIINAGVVATTTAYKTTIALDGKTIFTFNDPAGLTVNSFYSSTALNFGKLSAGTHTITMVADPGNTVSETNDANNTFPVTFTVGAASLPDLQPYIPTGWSSPLVVTTKAGNTTDAAKITTADTVFFDAAYINNGKAPVTVAYHSVLKIDGTTVFTINDNDPPQDVGIYDFGTGFNIGKLTAGSHTFTLVIDPTNLIAESNENNNTYTRTITVTGTSTGPAIGSLTVAPTSVSAGTAVTLTANSVTAPSSTVASVAFYLETNGQTGLQTGTGGDKALGTDTTSPYTFNAATTGLALGTHTFYAVATDALARKSTAVSTTLTIKAATATGSIAGFVYKDANGNGTKDSGEAALSNWTVYLDTNKNGKLDTGETSVLSASDGSYSFKNLALGAYSVREVVQSGYTLTAPTGGVWSPTLTAAAPSATAKNFGDKAVTTTTTGSIAGSVFKDANGNGTKDSGEAGLSFWTVYLDKNSNGKFDTGDTSALTASDGSYSFKSLPIGTYSVREVLQSGYTLTAPTGGVWSVTLTAAAPNATAKVFGDETTPTTGTISGTVYKDANGNGVKDGSEAGLGFWTVYLDKNKNGKFDSGDVSVVTNSAGAYTFSNVTFGAYSVREVVQAGYTITAPTGGSFAVTLAASTPNATGKNFGDSSLPTTGTISGTVFNDANGNGVLNTGEAGLSFWTVYLDKNKNGKFDTGDVSALTNSSGVYSFTGVAFGAYVVREVLQSGYTLTGPAGGSYAVTLAAATATATGKNFGDQKGATTGSISGTVFSDTNGNGTKDSGDAGLFGWIVYLDLDHNGTPSGSDPFVQTDASGNFSFTGLAFGTYTVREILNSGYTLKSPSSGSLSVTISGAVPKATGKNFADQPS